jgi:hypothetical protein
VGGVDIEKDIAIEGFDFLTSLEIPEEGYEAGQIISVQEVFPASEDVKGTRFGRLGLLWQMYGKHKKRTFTFRYYPSVPATFPGNLAGFIIWDATEAETFEAETNAERLRSANATSGFSSANVWSQFSVPADWPPGYTTLYTNGTSTEGELLGFARLYLIAMTPITRVDGVSALGYIHFDWSVHMYKTIVDESDSRSGFEVLGTSGVIASSNTSAVQPSEVGSFQAQLYDGSALTLARPTKRLKVGLGELPDWITTIANLLPGGSLVTSLVDAAGRLFSGITNNSKKDQELDVSCSYSKAYKQDLSPDEYYLGGFDGYNLMTNAMNKAWYLGSDQYIFEDGAIYGTPGVEIAPTVNYIPQSKAYPDRSVSSTSDMPLVPGDEDSFRWRTLPFQLDSGGSTTTKSGLGFSGRESFVRVKVPPGESWFPTPWTRPPAPPVDSVFEKTAIVTLPGPVDKVFDGAEIDSIDSGVTKAAFRAQTDPSPIPVSYFRKLPTHRLAQVVSPDVAALWYTYDLSDHPYVHLMTPHTKAHYLAYQNRFGRSRRIHLKKRITLVGKPLAVKPSLADTLGTRPVGHVTKIEKTRSSVYSEYDKLVARAATLSIKETGTSGNPAS